MDEDNDFPCIHGIKYLRVKTFISRRDGFTVMVANEGRKDILLFQQ